MYNILCRGLVKWYDRGLQKPLVGVRFSHPLLEILENKGFCASSSSRVIIGVIKEISYESIKLDPMVFFLFAKNRAVKNFNLYKKEENT